MGVSLEGYQSYEAQIAVPSGSDISTWIWLDNYQLSPQPAHVAASISATPSLGSVHGLASFDRGLRSAPCWSGVLRSRYESYRPELGDDILPVSALRVDRLCLDGVGQVVRTTTENDDSSEALAILKA
jgi:hypothetical protein